MDHVRSVDGHRALSGVSLLKRVLVGRPLASAEASHERLRKLVALPIFSADAIASTRVRHRGDPPRPRAGRRHGGARLPGPDQPRGRRAARHRRRQLPPDDLRLPERGRVLHREPREPRHRGLARRRVVPPRRLRADRGRVDRRRHRRDRVGRRAPAGPPGGRGRGAHRAGGPGQPARHAGVRAAVRRAHLRVHRRPRGADRVGPRRSSPSATWRRCRWTRRRCASSPATPPLASGATWFLLARAFSSGAVALSGVEAISNGIPAFRPPESRNAAITLTWTGTILATLFTGVAVLDLAPAADPVRGPDDPVDHGAGGVRQRAPLLGAAGGHGRHPRAVGQHRLRRLPPPRLDHLPGRLPAAPAPHPGRPPGVLQRDHRPDAGGGRAAGGVRRHHDAADPPVRGRPVRLLHAVAGGHGRPPPPPPGARMALAPGGQRRGRHDDRRGAGRGRGVEVHRGGVDPDRGDPPDRGRVPGDPPPLRHAPGGDHARSRHAGTGVPPHGGRARRAVAPRRTAGARLRQVAAPRAPGGGARGDRRRGRRRGPGGVGRPSLRRAAGGGRVAVPGPDRVRSSTTWTTSTPGGSRTRSRSSSPRSWSTVGTRTCCTTRARWR